MIALVQRVKRSSVKIENRLVNKIDKGLNILVGISKDDSYDDIQKLIKKIVNLRIFPNKDGKMSLSIKDIDAKALVVSQFTLVADIKKGRRPSFDNAMPPKEAKILYDNFCKELEKIIEVRRGVFGALMEVEIINDGPVTFIIDSKDLP